MKSFLAVASLAFLAAAMANPTPSNTIAYEDKEGNIITEDLDAPVPVTYAVDIAQQKFMLYTPSNKATPYELKVGDTNLLQKSPINFNIPTKVLIHGWQNTYKDEAMQIIKDAYLANTQVNVLICDYSPYNAPYLTAVSNAKKIGANIGQVLSFLIQQGLKVQDLHVIGHSLGAHIAGFTAQSMSYKLPRVSGLDAAGPMFNNKAASDRLSSDDAAYVECLHTSTALGMTNRCGTTDFYPNAGSDQPACLQASAPGGCDHAASYRYWAQSIANKNAFPARSCKSESDAQSNDKGLTACTASTAVMGEDAINRTKEGVYYVSVL